MSSYSLVWESFYLEENSGNQPFSYFCTYSDHFLKLSLLRNLDDLKQLYVCVRVWMCTRTCPHMLSSSVVSDSLQPHGLQPARLLCPWNFPRKNIGWVAISYSRGSSQPKDQTCVSCFGRQILSTEPAGKPIYPYNKAQIKKQDKFITPENSLLLLSS